MKIKVRSLSRIWLRLTGCLRHKQDGDDDDDDLWSKQLPDDIMQLVLKRLPLSDYLHCRDVCPSWRAAIDSKRCLPAPHQLVCLLIDSEHVFSIKDGCFVSDGKIHRPNSIVNYQWDCVGSIEGWLIMFAREGFTNYSHFFLNPISGARVMLPSKPMLPPYPILRSRERVVASSVPTDQNCYVASLDIVRSRLFFCRITEKSWTLIEAVNEEQKALEFCNVEILDDKLYAVTSNAWGFVMVFHIKSDANVGLSTYTAERVVLHHPSNTGERYLSRFPLFYRNVWYLAKDFESKELFIILGNTSRPQNRTEGFQLWKLECNITGGPRWVEIFDLGNRTLFVSGGNYKFISSTSGLGGFQDETFERNSIYFALLQPKENKVDFGVFSLTHRSVKPLTCPLNDHVPFFSLQRTFWFTPNPWEHVWVNRT